MEWSQLCGAAPLGPLARIQTPNGGVEPRISLITLGVDNVERSCRFYKDGLKLPTTRTPESGVIFGSSLSGVGSGG